MDKKLKHYPYVPDGNPVHDNHVAPKKYVDGIANGLRASLSAVNQNVGGDYNTSLSVHADWISDITSSVDTIWLSISTVNENAGGGDYNTSLSTHAEWISDVTTSISAISVAIGTISTWIPSAGTSVFTSATAAASSKAEGFATSVFTSATNKASSFAESTGLSVFTSATNRASIFAESAGISVFTSATNRSSTQAASTGSSVFASASNAVSMTASAIWESIGALTSRVTNISQSITALWASLSTVNESGGGGGGGSVSMTMDYLYADAASVSILVANSIKVSTTTFTAFDVISAALSSSTGVFGSASIDFLAVKSLSISTDMRASTGVFNSISTSGLWNPSVSALSEYVPSLHTSVTGIYSDLTTSASIAHKVCNTVGVLSNMFVSASSELSVFTSATNRASSFAESVGLSVFTSATNKSSAFAESIGLSVFTSATNKASSFAESVGLSVFTSATNRASTQASSIGLSVFGSASNAISMTASVLWEGISSTSTTVRSSASALTSASVETLRASVASWIPSTSALVNSEASVMAISVGNSVSNALSSAISQSVETVRASLNALSTSVSQYQSVQNYSVSTSVFKGSSISISNIYATSASINAFLYAQSVSCSSFYCIDEISVGTSAKSNFKGNIAIGDGVGNDISCTVDVLVNVRSSVNTGIESKTGGAGIFANPFFAPSATASNATFYGIGGYINFRNANIGSNAKGYGLQFGPFTFAAVVGNSASMSIMGIETWGTHWYMGAFNASDVIGIHVAGIGNSMTKAYITQDTHIQNAYGVIIDYPLYQCANASISISNAVNLLIRHTTTIYSSGGVDYNPANMYHVRLDGQGTGHGIFFNFSGSTSVARIYSSSPNNLIIAAGSSRPIFNISNSAMAFFDSAPKVQQTIRPTTGWSTSIKYFSSLANCSLSGNSTASINACLSDAMAFIGTLADRLCSIGIFRST